MRSAVVMLFALSLFSAGAMAHSGGHGGVDEKTAIAVASDVAVQMTEFDAGLGFGKLDPSWSKVPASAKSIFVKGDGYYIVALENAKAGKTLYVLMSNTGSVFDVNFSGNFPRLQSSVQSTRIDSTHK